jgi:alpha-ribazole phosphatase
MTTTTTKLWLARHAQPLIAPGVCYGATDVAANAQATLQAAEALAQCLPAGLQLVSSPLQRCVQLTSCLHALRPDLVCQTDTRLAEMDFGCWEGQRWDAIPQADYERWTADFGAHAFGGKESVQAFMLRVAAAWDEAQLGGLETVWITHAGVIRAATLLAQGVRQVTQAAQWPVSAPAFGAWCQLGS